MLRVDIRWLEGRAYWSCGIRGRLLGGRFDLDPRPEVRVSLTSAWMESDRTYVCVYIYDYVVTSVSHGCDIVEGFKKVSRKLSL